FAHYSTSKSMRESDLARNDSLNWRGLHRAWSYVNWHSGLIAMTSGTARVGFAASEHATERIRYKHLSTVPLPGTLITTRYGKTRAASNSVDLGGDGPRADYPHT